MMWISDAGGFDTVAIADPVPHLSPELCEQLRALSGAELESLSERAGDLSDEVFWSLKSLRLAPDTTDQFVGMPLPDEIVLDLPRSGPLFEGLREQVLAVSPRWRLDAALVLEDAVDLIEAGPS